MKKLNKNDFVVIDEFDMDVSKRVKVYEDENGNIRVFDEFDLEITRIVKVIKTTAYTKAVEKMEAHAEYLTACSNRSLMTVSEAINRFSTYIRCMIDNELCGAGFGANRIEEFNENLLK